MQEEEEQNCLWVCLSCWGEAELQVAVAAGVVGVAGHSCA